MVKKIGLNKLRFIRVLSSDGKFGVQWMKIILVLVGTQYRFYHRGNLTKSPKICQFCWFLSKPELCLITGLISFLTPINLKSGNKSSLKLNLQPWNPRFLVYLFYIRMTLTLPPLLTRLECTTHSKINSIFIQRSCYVNNLLYKKFVDLYGQFNFQFWMFVTFSASSTPNMMFASLPHQLSEFDMPGWWSWRILCLHQGASTGSFCGNVSRSDLLKHNFLPATRV